MQSPDKKKILTKEWDLKLSAVKIRKEDMNRLVMNFLVTEVFLQKLSLRNAVHKLVHRLTGKSAAAGLCGGSTDI